MITQLDAADFSKTFAAAGPLTEDVNLYEEGGKMAPRLIRIGAGGTLHVVYAGGVEDTITYQSGDIDAIKAFVIKSDSSAQLITVYW
jgi:hypothetical protein